MILKNGKRIDGCTDTLPVGTVQPFLGLTPPLGYLVCQGQLVSKIEYPELYNICKSAFGAETETHFYLPDLRGKTIAGYDSSDTAMNTIGKLLGNKTHTHTSAAHTHTIAGHVHSTGNHTLTVAEMPSHTHTVPRPAHFASETENNGAMYTAFNTKTSSVYTTESNPTGGSGAHNHGNTGSTSLTTDSTTPGATGGNTNFQPTIVMNWIVKAVMLIPEYFVVENTLTSTSAGNALSAAQGKILNDKVNTLLPFSTRSDWTWGTLTVANGFTPIVEWMDVDGGGVAYAYKDTRTSVQIDGDFYQGEGKYRVLDTRDQAANYAFYKWPSMISISPSNPTVSKEFTITTRKGNPVLLLVSGDNNPQGDAAKKWFNINFYRNGTLLCHQICESHEASHNIPFCMQYLDVVGAGTYTYKVEFVAGAGQCDLGENGWMQTPNFTVIEL